MNKFIKLNGHNPESKSAKDHGEEVYICKTCWEIMTAKERKEKYGS